jgi:hypothetical protein
MQCNLVSNIGEPEVPYDSGDENFDDMFERDILFHQSKKSVVPAELLASIRIQNTV